MSGVGWLHPHLAVLARSKEGVLCDLLRKAVLIRFRFLSLSLNNAHLCVGYICASLQLTRNTSLTLPQLRTSPSYLQVLILLYSLLGLL